jgi:hypothetical protein
MEKDIASGAEFAYKTKHCASTTVSSRAQTRNEDYRDFLGAQIRALGPRSERLLASSCRAEPDFSVCLTRNAPASYAPTALLKNSYECPFDKRSTSFRRNGVKDGHTFPTQMNES